VLEDKKMKKQLKFILMSLLLISFGAQAQTIDPPYSAGTGIWIQQVGTLYPSNPTSATLYYTLYSTENRVKSVDYYYDGNGYLQLSNKVTLCRSSDGLAGADGIVHHPDNDLLIAAQGSKIHKVNKTVGPGNNCLVKTVIGNSKTGNYHLMMDPTNEVLWGAGIPGTLSSYKTTIDPANSSLQNGKQIQLKQKVPNSRFNSNHLSTIIWDEDGTAFYTYSGYFGGGCEASSSGTLCNDAQQKAARAKAHFGMFSDTIPQGAKGSAIDIIQTSILIDSLEGAHGGTYDTYSKTIFVFGGSKIVQIDPRTRKVVATIDLRQYFFIESLENLTKPRTYDGGYVGWRLDQGTVDGLGHLFVASNTGHLIFIDYTSNPNKYINDNVHIHMQWLDDFLDDVAPLSGVGSSRHNASTGTDEDYSSSSRNYSSSSHAVLSSSSSVTSSSSSGGTGTSSSSGGTGTSSSSGGTGISSSSGGTGTSSSSGGTGISSSSGGTGTSSSSGGTGTSSSSGGTGTSSSSGGTGTSSSSGGTGTSSSSGGTGTSSSSGGSGTGDDLSSSSSSGNGSGSGDDTDLSSSSSKQYTGFDDFDLDDDDDPLPYPSDDKREKGDSIVVGGTVLNPVDAEPGTPGTITIGGNVYDLTTPGISLDGFGVNNGSDKEPVNVGQVIEVTISAEKLLEYLGVGAGDSIFITGVGGVQLVDPNKASDPSTKTTVVSSGGDVKIYVTSDTVVNGGQIYIQNELGETVIFDGFNFIDPIPDALVGFIKDSEGDGKLDMVEVVLTEPLPSKMTVTAMSIVINGDTLEVTSVPNLNKDRITADVTSLVFPENFPKDAYAILTYTDSETGTSYKREASLVEVGGHVIKQAYAIRNDSGQDSLFIEFNIDLLPADVSQADFIVMLNKNGFDLDQVSSISMPTKNLIVITGDSLGLRGADRDSVSLYPNISFTNLPYMTSDEYSRQIVVKVTDRLPSAQYVEYYDTDGDGVLDQIVTVFADTISQKDMQKLYMSFPWYSFRGMLIQLQAQPASLEIDPKDPTRVIWNVQSDIKLTTGLTSISDEMPQATIYTYYDVMGYTFVGENNTIIRDKMSPVIKGANLRYGSGVDTLIVQFSEVVNKSKIDGKDYFSYIHGNDTIDLIPSRIEWSNDGLTAKLVLNSGFNSILPGDSLMMVPGNKGSIQDNAGNIAGELPSPVVISGFLNQLVHSVNMGSLNSEDETLRELSSVSLSYLPNTTRKEDLEKKGVLGHLVELGQRFVPQLVDAAQVDANGEYDSSVLDSLDPAKVMLSFSVRYFDHVGQYVNDTTISVACNSPKFGGNCLNTDQKLFVNWNFKDRAGRFVGAGVYLVQFKLVARYENKTVEEEVIDKWGVRRSKKGTVPLNE
jgi:hypothetical protein